MSIPLQSLARARTLAGMTFAPPTLVALGAWWTAQGGVNLGIVGDAGHAARGVSYHLGRDDLVPDAYSIRTARDRAGLSNAASAIDLGKLDGSYVKLRTFSRWLVEQARSNADGTDDMREIIYSPDGVTVLRWDRERGYASLPQSGEADNTHLAHTHISFYRDAEFRDHRTAFYSWGDSMSIYTRREATGTAIMKAGTRVRGYRPAANGWTVALSHDFTAQGTARFGAQLSRITGSTVPASLLEMTSGMFAGMYVSTAEVEETFDPVPPAADCTAQEARIIELAAKLHSVRLIADTEA